MAQKETVKPLTKAELEKIRSGINGLMGKMLALVDEIHTEGIPPKLSQQIAYQAGMVKYGMRQAEALVGSLDQAGKSKSRSPRAPKAEAKA